MMIDIIQQNVCVEWSKQETMNFWMKYGQLPSIYTSIIKAEGFKSFSYLTESKLIFASISNQSLMLYISKAPQNLR